MGEMTSTKLCSVFQDCHTHTADISEYKKTGGKNLFTVLMKIAATLV